MDDPGVNRTALSEDHELSGRLETYLGWLEARDIAAMTIAHRRTDLESFFTWAAERSLDRPEEISLAILEAWQSHVSHLRKMNGKPLANRTQRKRVATLQDYFAYASMMPSRSHGAMREAHDVIGGDRDPSGRVGYKKHESCPKLVRTGLGADSYEGHHWRALFAAN